MSLGFVHRWICVEPSRLWAAALAMALLPGVARGGTFLDRVAATDLRVVSWNTNFDSIIPGFDGTRGSGKFARVAAAVAPDVWAFQELYNSTATDLKSLLDAAQPLGTPQGWYVYRQSEDGIASKYPLTLGRTSTVPAGYQQAGMSLVDLPDTLFAHDLYLIDTHSKCCGGYDSARQKQSDSYVNWMRDARTAGGSITLAAGTPMMVLGDFNLVDGMQPLTTVLNGDIQDNATYGADSPPDWDGTANVAATALHNGVGPDTYTWRDDTSSFPRSRLDYVTYTDSVMTLTHSFVLNSVTMSAADRAATGLQTYDSVYKSNDYDHLPVVADFHIPGPPAAADFNLDGAVDALDLGLWAAGFGSVGAGRASGDADGNTAVDGNDLLLWQRQLSNLSVVGATAAAPEPLSGSLLVLAAFGLGCSPRLRGELSLRPKA